VISAGWIAVASWPIDTERAGRLRAMGSAALASSVHLVCRPRRISAARCAQTKSAIWRDCVTRNYPNAYTIGCPDLPTKASSGARLQSSRVLGPALEIFSRYSRVEEGGAAEIPTLREYLEHVWAAVSTEALTMTFAMPMPPVWSPMRASPQCGSGRWVEGKTATNGNGSPSEGEGEEDTGDDEEAVGAKASPVGYTLEFDAARKIAQGLGIHHRQERIDRGRERRHGPFCFRSVNEPISVWQRCHAGAARTGKGKKKVQQKTLFDEAGRAAEAAEAGWTEVKGPPPGTTVLDRLHQR